MSHHVPWVYGLPLVFLMMVLCGQAFAEDEAVLVKRIVSAHEKALKVYKTKHDSFDAMIVMRDSGIDNIIQIKPEKMETSDYVSVLNDYGFFLSDQNMEEFSDISIKCLRRVIGISPTRTPAYLNLGDALFTKLRYVYSYTEKMNMAKEIESLYRYYKVSSGEKIKRVDSFIEHNISHDTSKNICEYITKNANNGISRQMFSDIGSEDMPTLCDVNMDNKEEYVYKDVYGNKYEILKIKQYISDDWIDCESNQKDNINMDDYFDQDDQESVEIFENISLVPYKDGVYCARYAGYISDPYTYIISISRIQMDRFNYVCLFKVTNKEFMDSCTNTKLCEYVSKKNKINYVQNKEKYNVKVDGEKLFDLMPEYYNNVIDFDPFLFESTIYIDVKSTYKFKPFHEIWKINKGKKEVINTYRFQIIHVSIYDCSIK